MHYFYNLQANSRKASSQGLHQRQQFASRQRTEGEKSSFRGEVINKQPKRPKKHAFQTTREHMRTLAQPFRMKDGKPRTSSFYFLKVLWRQHTLSKTNTTALMVWLTFWYSATRSEHGSGTTSSVWISVIIYSCMTRQTRRSSSCCYFSKCLK